MILGLFYRNWLNFSDNTDLPVLMCEKSISMECYNITHSNFFKAIKLSRKTWF